MATENLDSLLTETQAAVQLGVSLRTIREARWFGNLKYLRIGKKIFLHPDDLLVYMKKRSRGHGKTRTKKKSASRR